MKFETKEQLIDKLKEKKYLTSDSFSSPDRVYIFLNERKEEPLRVMEMGDVEMEFNFNVYKNSIFREVERKYPNNEANYL